MKQLIIGKDKAYATGVTYNDLTKVADGVIGVFDPSTGELISTASGIKNTFAVVCGRGNGKMPVHFPEVNARNLTIAKATYVAGATFSAKITIPTPEANKHYTVIVVKKGTVFNERSNWSFTSMAKGAIAADVAKDITNQINGNSENLGVTATYEGGAITITGVKEGDNFEVIGADELTGVAPTDVTIGKVAVLDKAYMQDLASRCAAGKGFNYLGEDGKEIYPGYPEPVDADKYVLYTLRFAVPRVAAKQRDEVVYQILHIAVPQGAACVTTLDTIFNISDSTGQTSFDKIDCSDDSSGSTGSGSTGSRSEDDTSM